MLKFKKLKSHISYILLFILQASLLFIAVLHSERFINLVINAEDLNKNTSETAKSNNTDNKKIDENIISFEINSTPCFLNPESEGNLLIKNPSDNNNKFTVEIFDKNNEIIYKSDCLKPGESVDNGKLTKALPKGKHKCIASFKAYSLYNEKYLGKVSAEITLYVLNDK